jgi:hypothetical protein
MLWCAVVWCGVQFRIKATNRAILELERLQHPILGPQVRPHKLLIGV